MRLFRWWQLTLRWWWWSIGAAAQVVADDADVEAVVVRQWGYSSGSSRGRPIDAGTHADRSSMDLNMQSIQDNAKILTDVPAEYDEDAESALSNIGGTRGGVDQSTDFGIQPGTLRGHWEVPSVDNDTDTTENTLENVNKRPTEPKPLHLPAGSVRCCANESDERGE